MVNLSKRDSPLATYNANTIAHFGQWIYGAVEEVKSLIKAGVVFQQREVRKKTGLGIYDVQEALGVIATALSFIGLSPKRLLGSGAGFN